MRSFICSDVFGDGLAARDAVCVLSQLSGELGCHRGLEDADGDAFSTGEEYCCVED